MAISGALSPSAQAAPTKYHSEWLQQQKLTFAQLIEPMIKVLANVVSDESSLPGL